MLIGVNFFCSNVIIFLFCYNATTMLILIYNYNCNLSHLSDYMHSYATHDACSYSDNILDWSAYTSDQLGQWFILAITLYQPFNAARYIWPKGPNSQK